MSIGDSVSLNCTVLFSDIRGFTSMSELMSPEQNFAFLNEFFAKMAPIIRKYGGVVDKYIGDSIMALFPVCHQEILYNVT